MCVCVYVATACISVATMFDSFSQRDRYTHFSASLNIAVCTDIRDNTHIYAHMPIHNTVANNCVILHCLTTFHMCRFYGDLFTCASEYRIKS